MSAQTVPTYALYGDATHGVPPEWLHCETIAERSRRYQWVIRPHRHERLHHLLHVTGGSGTLHLGARIVEITPPSVLLIPAGTVHGFRFSRDVEGQVLTFLPDRGLQPFETLPELMSVLCEPRQITLPARGEPTRQLAAHVASIAAEFRAHEPGRATALQAHLAAALVLLARLAGREAAAPVPGRAYRQALRFRELAASECTRHLPLRFYAERLGITPTHLNRISRQVLGSSALGVIQQSLMRQATRELTFTLRSVGEIALQLGFADPAYFSRFFARHAGVSPRRYRLQATRATAAEPSPELCVRPARGG